MIKLNRIKRNYFLGTFNSLVQYKSLYSVSLDFWTVRIQNRNWPYINNNKVFFLTLFQIYKERKLFLVLRFTQENLKRKISKTSHWSLHNEDRIHQVPRMDLCVGCLPLPQCGVEIAAVKDPLGRGLVGFHILSVRYMTI